MKCMKCGRDLKDSSAFCADCQADMEKHPVKPNTPIYLPPRTAAPPPKKKPSRKKAVKPEEQVYSLRRNIRWLVLALIIVILGYILTTALLLQVVEKKTGEPITAYISGMEY